MFVKKNFLQLINRTFFLFFKIFKVFLSKPLDRIISKKVLFNSRANFFLITELTATTPPNALIGSQPSAFL